jgi:hypothetical protein
MSDLIWLHEDGLRADHPVFAAAGVNNSAVFIWDDAYLQQMDYGFKRLVFIYETLVELPLTILRGDQFECLTRLAGEAGGRILAPATPNPRLQQTLERLRRGFEVEMVEDVAFAPLPQEVDLKRFFRYWNKARKVAMSPSSGSRTDSQ